MFNYFFKRYHSFKPFRCVLLEGIKKCRPGTVYKELFSVNKYTSNLLLAKIDVMEDFSMQIYKFLFQKTMFPMFN